ncbi:MAG: outer membrane beta-barrel protein [candidate division Zixibacteria bacterium]|nr:outer membrane beta-barrel protein [candidate division Zixibacteria bacterium]
MRGITIIVFMVLVIGGQVDAQERKPLELSLGVEMSLPAHPDQFTDGWKAGPGGMFGVGYNVASNIDIMAKAEYHVFPHDPPLPYTNDTDKGRKRIFMFGVDGVANERIGAGPVGFVFLAGVGVAHATVFGIEQGGDTVIRETAETGIYFNVGGGFQWDVGKGKALFIHGRYVGILTEEEGTSFFPITVGFRF